MKKGALNWFCEVRFPKLGNSMVSRPTKGLPMFFVNALCKK